MHVLKACSAVIIAVLFCNPSQAGTRRYDTRDGQFSICKYDAPTDCELLTANILNEDRFTDRDRYNVKTLTELASTEVFSKDQIVKAFGTPDSVLRPPPEGGDSEDNFTFHWQADKEQCGRCGIWLRTFRGRIFSAHYEVYGKFRIMWFANIKEKTVQEHLK
jgi:hypothetical protein